MHKKLLVLTLIVTAMFCWLNAEQKVINLSYNAGDFEFTTTSDGTQIKYHGIQNVVYSNVPGSPNLPNHIVTVSVPDGAQYQDLLFTYDSVVVRSDVIISPAQHEITTSNYSSDVPVADPEPQYYAVGEYPENLCRYESTHKMGPYRLFTFKISPFIYFPLTNQLKLITTCTIQIDYTLTDFGNDIRWDDRSIGLALQQMVANPVDLVIQDDRPPIETDVKYLIITKNLLVSSFQPLADWKTRKGIKTQIVTVESILNNPSFQGSTPEEKIKSCIKYYYEQHHTKWVLLGGNTDVVPSRICYSHVTLSGLNPPPPEAFNVQSDLYYACFDNNFQWNQNNNAIYGEIDDNIDFAPEVIIGRAAVRDANINTFVQKTLAYEQTPPSSNFANQALMIGSRVDMSINDGYYQNLSHTQWHCEDLWSNHMYPYWPNSNRSRFYDTTNDFGQFTTNNLISTINTGYNVTFESSHGNSSMWDFGPGVAGVYFNTNNVNSITNGSRQGLLYSIACETNHFEANTGSQSLGSSFIERSGGGSVVYIGNTGLGITYRLIPSNVSNSGPSFSYAKSFFPSLLSAANTINSSIGDCLNFSKAQYLGMIGNTYNSWRHIMFGLNLQGDPELNLLTANPTTMTVLHPQYFFSGSNSSNYPLVIEVGLSNALVCISNGVDVYTYGYTNQNGSISFSINTQSTASLTITVTAKNKLPYTNQIQVRPTLVHVPAQASTIQEGIDLVADGGTVIVASGTYSVNELSWANKHVRLLGSGNPVLTSGSHAIKLDWSGINNTDRIHGFTFQNCYGYDNGPAIMLLEGASPLVSNCTFDDNRVQSEYNMEFNNPSGFGGAVFIEGGSNQSISPRFENCTFTNNAAANGNGGGAVALFGPASFLSCTFTNNWTSTAVGFGPPAYFAAGAILIYGNDYNGDILIHNCTFTGNYGQNRANDIWVAGSRGINNLTIDNCTFNPDTSYSSEPVIRLFYDSMPSSEASTTDFILSMNKFNLSDKGAVYFHDYAGRCSMQFNNNVVNGLEGLTYGLKLHYYGGAPQNPDYFQFNNNTLLNLTSSGLVLFKGSDYTIENNIFHNCSPYDVEWGGHSGIPDYATESLTINNCFFNDLNNHVDTQGNTYQVFSISNPVVASDPQLDANYIPIWNATTMSHCIDKGTGVNDSDGTPPDIGAYPATSHTREVYTMPMGGTPKWMSFPVLNRITQGYDTTGNFFAPITDVDVLDQVIWKDGGNEPVTMRWYMSVLQNFDKQVRSVLGYKMNLQPGVTQAIQIPIPGSIQAPNTVINLFAHPAGSSTGVNENWIGYYLPQSSSPFTALASILDKVTSIKTQYWSAIKGNGFWKVSSANLTLNYGDMVVLTVTEDCSFAWSNVTPIDPKVRPKATAFEYVEKLDYMPMFIDLSGFEVLPSEIGLYVNGGCKGAVKVEGSYTDLCAYLDKYEVINPDDCELVLYFDTKAMDNVKQRCKLDSNSIKLNNEYGVQYYELMLSSATDINPVIPKTALSPNYPNPFNPETTISYEIASDGVAKMEIFNLKGQLVKTLVNETKVSGPHKVVWNGTDKYGRKVASGLYQYRLTTKEGSITKKMMLMK